VEQTIDFGVSVLLICALKSNLGSERVIFVYLVLRWRLQDVATAIGVET